MKQLRERVNLRTVDVASRLEIAESTVRNWEHGRSVPRFELVRPLMELYQCDFDDIDQAVRQTKLESGVQE